jgi:hypothetical protein
MSDSIELTIFTKEGGPLTKLIKLDEAGKVVSDSSECRMARGRARRARVGGVDDLAKLISSLRKEQAIALGTIRLDQPDDVAITTKGELNGEHVGLIARTGSDIIYRKDVPTFVLFDLDTKGMPEDVAQRITAAGGYWKALVGVLPKLAAAGHLIRASTSAGLRRTDTGEDIEGSGGLHAYVAIKDGTDAERFLQTLHDRCWLNGLGWMIVSQAGQILKRSIVDRMVGAPERLVFEGPPAVEPPLEQDQLKRQPIFALGGVIDSQSTCPPLTVVEKQALRKRIAEASQLSLPESHRVRDAFVARQVERRIRDGMSEPAARRVVELSYNGILLPDFELTLEDGTVVTVGDALANPGRFEGLTLADPIEGGDDRRIAKIMRGAGGIPIIHSFAHGKAMYRLRYDAASLARAVEASQNPIETLTQMVIWAELDEIEMAKLIADQARQDGIGIKPTRAKVKAALEAHRRSMAKEAKERQLAERNDPRPQVPCPPPRRALAFGDGQHQRGDGGNEIGFANAPQHRREPHPRSQVSSSKDPSFHQRKRKQGGRRMTKLPPPEQWALVKMTLEEAAEEIERHIDYVDENGRSVHLPTPFVRHYMNRHDGVLPTVVAIATAPIILADGGVLAKEKDNDLDIERGIEFHIPPEVMALLPKRKDCTPDAVARAMKFLTDEWLCDVLGSFKDKCVVVAAALTLIERSLLPDRPVFFVTAGRRGSGKTTLLTMLIMAVTGILPAAAAWSPNKEERRKAILSYFLYGVAYIIWDNIERGTAISCPHIEKSCTASYYTDRKLGVSEMVATSASTIHFFTGNNVGPKGDLASRSLVVRLATERADPENRSFTHNDPVGWTEDHRAEIMTALYTILLGNPTLDEPHNAAMKTRFKMWWRLVGSTVEYAAKQCDHEVDFGTLFRGVEEEDEDDVSLGEVLDAMMRTWKNTDPDKVDKESRSFLAKDVADAINEFDHQYQDTFKSFLCPLLPHGHRASPISIGKKLKHHADEPVIKDGKTFILKAEKDPTGNDPSRYKVVRVTDNG